MFNFLVTAEGGLTTAGYAVSVIAVLILIILVAVLLQKNTSALKFTTHQLVTCAVALALAYVTSYIKIFKLPFGGYLYWMDYMPDNFPKSLTALYPIIYNYSYILLEGVLTIVVISIPAVSSALGRMRIMATGGNRQSAATEK